MYHSLHGTAGLQIPWMQLRGQSQPRLTGGVGVSQKFPFSSTAVVGKSLQRFRCSYNKNITMPPFQQRMMGWIYQTNFLANFLQMSPRSSNIYQRLSKLNCIAQYHIWKLPTGANCIDYNPHKAATMKANVSSQPLAESIQSHWDDFHHSLGPGTCQCVLLVGTERFLWYTLQGIYSQYYFSENVVRKNYSRQCALPESPVLPFQEVSLLWGPRLFPNTSFTTSSL